MHATCLSSLHSMTNCPLCVLIVDCRFSIVQVIYIYHVCTYFNLFIYHTYISPRKLDNFPHCLRQEKRMQRKFN